MAGRGAGLNRLRSADKSRDGGSLLLCKLALKVIFNVSRLSGFLALVNMIE